MGAVLAVKQQNAIEAAPVATTVVVDPMNIDMTIAEPKSGFFAQQQGVDTMLDDAFALNEVNVNIKMLSELAGKITDDPELSKEIEGALTRLRSVNGNAGAARQVLAEIRGVTSRAESHVAGADTTSAGYGSSKALASGKVPSSEALINSTYVRNGRVTDLAGFAEEFDYNKEYLQQYQANVLSRYSGLSNNATILAAVGESEQQDPQRAKKRADVVARNVDEHPEAGLVAQAGATADVLYDGFLAGSRQAQLQMDAFDTWSEQPEVKAAYFAAKNLDPNDPEAQAAYAKMLADTKLGLTYFPNKYRELGLSDEAVDFAAIEKSNAEAKRAHDALLSEMPAAEVAALRDYARSQGIDVNSPFWVPKLRAEHPVDDATAIAINAIPPHLRTAEQKGQLAFATIGKRYEDIEGYKSMGTMIRLMDSKFPTPEALSSGFYDKSPTERVALIEEMYREEYGGTLDPQRRDTLMKNLAFVRTPEELKALARGVYEAEKTNDWSKVDVVQTSLLAARATELRTSIADGITSATDSLKGYLGLGAATEGASFNLTTVASQVPQDNLQRDAYSTIAYYTRTAAYWADASDSSSLMTVIGGGIQRNMGYMPTMPVELTSGVDDYRPQAEVEAMEKAASKKLYDSANIYLGNIRDGVTPSPEVKADAEEYFFQQEVRRLSGGETMGQVQYFDAAEAAVRARFERDEGLLVVAQKDQLGAMAQEAVTAMQPESAEPLNLAHGAGAVLSGQAADLEKNADALAAIEPAKAALLRAQANALREKAAEIAKAGDEIQAGMTAALEATPVGVQEAKAIKEDALIAAQAAAVAALEEASIVPPAKPAAGVPEDPATKALREAAEKSGVKPMAGVSVSTDTPTVPVDKETRDAAAEVAAAAAPAAAAGAGAAADVAPAAAAETKVPNQVAAVLPPIPASGVGPR